ncbi:nSTAND1 domain-containing NTPase [Mesorhizobium sp. L-8-3]|uniref:nSTAND1 domain-containing NTPase n=1 Tax=Mesorhizobium sp. L-8-3 TaxID=2744522 RepID=UPI001928EBDA|nr:S8 family serine peptidase [Mesorhizobium sp. L-8-3]BCH23522.1 hypothetical protein MesoLjLb_33070 [Mesorhizobium sp. L-8-3]
MLDLDGSQIKVFRTGLQSAFVQSDALSLFLREELDRHLNFYAGGNDPLPDAVFKLIEGAQAEGWIIELASKAYEARPKNRYLAEIANALGIEIDASKLEPASPVRSEPPLWQSLNPYRGLQVVREQDANFLFGRDDDIARFIATLAENPSKLFLALGASGVGKSSLVFAGIFAALDRQSLRGGKPWPAQLSQSRTWPRLILTPGPEPLRSLAGAFLRQWHDPKEAKFREETNSWRELLLKGDSLDGLVEALDAFLSKEKGDQPSRYLLYIDQGEELYTRGGREPGQDNTTKETQAQKEARRFSELVAIAARHPRIVVIMSARSDFLGRLQADAPLHAAKQQIDIAPLSPEGLSEVVRRPAKALDVAFEPGLDEALIEATRAQPGGLPLLSDTLDILWKEMQARGKPTLQWSRPLKEGVDVTLKLGERADGFVKARASEEPLLRRLFCVRLAYVPLQGEATRRTALLEELTEPERSFVAELAGSELRTVVTGERDGKATAEVAHEALFTGWQKLRDWIVSRRAFYAWIALNENDRKDWEDQGKASTALLTGRPLERAKSFLETDGEDVPTADRAFIEASIKADEEMHLRAKEQENRLREAELERKAYRELSTEIVSLRALYSESGIETESTGAQDSPVEIIQNNIAPPKSRRRSLATNWGLRALRTSETPFDGQGTVVAVLDTGIEATHPAFRGMKLIQKDFTGSGNGDNQGHGTFVASLIAGRDIRNERYGVARGVREMLVAKVLDDRGAGKQEDLVRALQWVSSYDNGRVDIICVSIGFDYPSYARRLIDSGHDPTVATSIALRSTIQLLRVYERLSVSISTIGKGALIVAPSGNESTERWRAAMTSPVSVARGVMSVGAIAPTDVGNQVAVFSNSHPTLCAPGVDCTAAQLGGGLQKISGTSPACAYVAGVAALWWQALRDRNPKTVVTSSSVSKAILESAKTEGFAPDTREIDRGAGLIQAPI